MGRSEGDARINVQDYKFLRIAAMTCDIPTHTDTEIERSWTEPSTRRVSSSQVGLVVGKKPDP